MIESPKEPMIKVKMLKSGEAREVTPNEAHGLIESGLAELFYEAKPMTSEGSSTGDSGKSGAKKYKIK